MQLRDGVAPSTVVLPSQPASFSLSGLAPLWATMAEFLIARFPNVDAATWQARIARGDVRHADGHVVTAQEPFAPGARIHYFRDVTDEALIPFFEAVLFQNDHLLVADKPHFLPVVPSGHYLRETLLVRLRERLKLAHLSPIHRIDRDTAGLVMFSVNPATRKLYHALFRERAVRKTYEAITRWNPDLPWHMEGATRTLRRASRIVPSGAHFMQMMEAVDAPAKDSNADTRIRVLRVAKDLAHLQLQPLTGQRHQLRVHLTALGMPIQNDGIYPVLRPEGDFDFSQPMQLLARSLAFDDPVTSQPCEFSSHRQLQLETMQGP
jgi:tRNA pseudouridine32 synthase / 23S rRNA pseudouridine746 synthase